MALDLYSGNSDLDSHISRKRRRCETEESELSIDGNQHGLRQLLAEEFDLEISLRQRLAATIESRITWALLLQDSLEKDFSDTSISNNFQDVALEALDAIDTHSSFLFERELSFAALEPWIRSFSPKVIAPSQPQQPSRTLKPRGAIRSQRGNTKLLFVQNATVDPPVVAKMVCPDCSRSDFTNLQGMLNHCRLRHKRDFGSHDECMQRCAVIVPAEDQDWVLAQGTELSGVSQPSLRRLFEIAVGADTDIVIEQHALLETEQASALQSREPAPSTHLSRTLGHHIDTPALAPFLGRAPKRRCINVYDDETIDITSLDRVSTEPGATPWRMSYSHRNNARQELDTIVDLPCPQLQLQPQPQPQPQPDPKPPPTINIVNAPADAKLSQLPDHANSGTRFHITARVIISDYSLWLRTDRANVAQDISHRWMLGVSSPSYSLHITAFLCQMTVTCLSQPPPSSLADPIVVTEPPFAVMGTSDKPFLARLTLVWVGKQNASMEVEHWVELDPFKSTSAVLGEEQVLDIELDRYTNLLPVRTDLKLPTLEREATKRDASANASSSKARGAAKGYATVLKSLLPRVPMTMKDVKGRPPSQLPYKLTSSPSHFSALVPGRRKAIEWGRARALHNQYEKQIKSFPSEGAVPLTTGDVYCWLEDEGYFIRPAIDPQPVTTARVIKRSAASSAQSAHSEICSLCGIKCRLHPSYTVKSESSGQEFICDIVQDRAAQPPCLNLKGVFGSALDLSLQRPPAPTSPAQPFPEEPHQSAQPKYLSRYSSRDILSLVPPSLITAVCGIANMTNTVPSIPHENRGSLDETTISSESRRSTEDRMAPYALVSTALKSFVAVLVHRGLDTARWDMTRALLDGRRKTKSCILTPSHIIRGIRSGLMTDSAHTAVALCLTRLAVPNGFGRSLHREDIQEDESKKLDEVRVKIENDY